MSAAAKLVVQEAESDALSAWLTDQPRLISSVLLRTELLRVVRRREPLLLQRAYQLVRGIDLHTVDETVLENAAALDPVTVRTLDAIHLATALSLASAIDALVTYDGDMIEAAKLLGLPVASPK